MTASDLSYAPATDSLVKPGYGLALAGAIGPTLAVFAYKGLAPLFFIVAVYELAVFWRNHRRVPLPSTVAALLFTAFVLWGVAGTAWSLNAAASLATAGKLALMAALGLPLISVARDLDSGQSRLTMIVGAGGLSAGLVLMAIEVFFGLPITHFFYSDFQIRNAVIPNLLDPAATVLVLAAAYTATDLLRRSHIILALVIAGAAATLAILSQSMAAGVAAVVAIPVFLAVYWGGASAGRTLAIVATAAILSAPLLPSRVLGPVENLNWSANAIASVFQRIGIWKFAQDSIDQRPILGWGLDAARRMPGGHDGIKADSFVIQNPALRERVTKYFDSGNIEQMPLHPHDAALQIWLEAGAVGAALAAGLVLVSLSAAARRWQVNRAGTAGAFAFGFAALIVAGLSYGIWQTWWLATLFLGAAFSQNVIADKPKSEAS